MHQFKCFHSIKQINWCSVSAEWMDILFLLYCYCDRQPSIQSNESRSFICVKYIHFTWVDLYHSFQRCTTNLPFGRNSAHWSSLCFSSPFYHLLIVVIDLFLGIISVLLLMKTEWRGIQIVSEMSIQNARPMPNCL